MSRETIRDELLREGWEGLGLQSAGHEGYLRGLVETDEAGIWVRRNGRTGLLPEVREFGEYVGDSPTHLDKATPVTLVQVGCTCGWRSPRFAAPATADWRPGIVDFHDGTLGMSAKDRARQLWQMHVNADRELLPSL
jgi:hypothetical protein